MQDENCARKEMMEKVIRLLTAYGLTLDNKDHGKNLIHKLLIETESSVGSFNVDIYAQEAGTGRKVIIENQLEDTNHGHLGKVITYAAGKGAEVVVWAVARARDEHRQAIEWLNQHTDSEFGFLLVEVELWQIGDSKPAPRLSVVERPNEWAKALKMSEGLSETGRIKLSYWTNYREIVGESLDKAKTINGKKTSGLRFWKNGCKIRGNEEAWPEYICEQLAWGLEMKRIVDGPGL